MKARRSTIPRKISQTHQRALKPTQHKKMLKMKMAPQSLLKTKGQKKFSPEFIENKGVIEFYLLPYDLEGVSEDFHASVAERLARANRDRSSEAI